MIGDRKSEWKDKKESRDTSIVGGISVKDVEILLGSNKDGQD